MKEVTASNFGLLIAYLLPGFVTLFGISFFSETVQSWLSVTPAAGPTVGGFLYITLASLAAGLTVSTIRWALIDTIHHRTGIPLPDQDFSFLQEKLSAYQYLVSTHYNYYKFYSNMNVAVLITFAAYLFTFKTPWNSVWTVAGFVFVEIIFWLGSRDTLRKYYSQGTLLLGGRTYPQSDNQLKSKLLNTARSSRTLNVVRQLKGRKFPLQSRTNKEKTTHHESVAETPPR